MLTIRLDRSLSDVHMATDLRAGVNPNPDSPIGLHEGRPNEDCLGLCMRDYAVRGG